MMIILGRVGLNGAILVDNESGDGMETWDLEKENMAKFERFYKKNVRVLTS